MAPRCSPCVYRRSGRCGFSAARRDWPPPAGTIGTKGYAKCIKSRLRLLWFFLNRQLRARPVPSFKDSGLPNDWKPRGRRSRWKEEFAGAPCNMNASASSASSVESCSPLVWSTGRGSRRAGLSITGHRAPEADRPGRGGHLAGLVVSGNKKGRLTEKVCACAQNSRTIQERI